MKIQCVLVTAVILACGISGAQAAPPFLKVGSWYSLTASPGTPLMPVASRNPTDVTTLRVKVIEPGSGEWCLVEYDDLSGAPAAVIKQREWLNFAFVTNVVPDSQPDYQKLYPGVKIVLYKGTIK